MGTTGGARGATLSRRTLALAGAGTLLAACSDTGPAPPPPAHSGAARTAWDLLRRHVHGRLCLPGEPGYDAVRLTENPRYDDAHPLAVLTVAGAADVATALAFARDHDVPLALRSGGHSYPGWSSGGARGTGMPRALVLDCRALGRVRLGPDGIVAVGAGAPLARVYDAVGRRGRALAGGSCATVGTSGLTLGGGVGVLTRALGLTCDALRSVEIVTADGRVRQVDAGRDPDLFWALRGGGGGHLGVVTALRFATVAAPALTTFYLTWPATAAETVIDAWQRWAPGADHRLWSTLKVLGGARHPDGPTVLVSGTWTGPSDRIDARLRELLDQVPGPRVRSIHVRGFRDAMMSYAGCAGIPVDRCHTGVGGALEREAFAATSHVGYDVLPAAGIGTLLDRVHDAGGSVLREAGISMDALGGRVRDLDPDATAFVHRRALLTVQYTATFDPPGGRRARAGQSYVRGFRSAMMPYWGNHAYVNYADRAVEDPAAAYFGANATRLASVKHDYDPADLFDQPQGY